MEAVVGLAVDAPGGPPVSAADFLARLDPAWLTDAYSSGGARVGRAPRRAGPDPDSVEAAWRHRAAVPHAVPAAGQRPGRAGRVRRRGRLVLHPRGHGRDQRGRGAGPGAGRPAGQLRGAPGRRPGPGRPRREILLAVDEFSAVARRLPIWDLYERARSLGLAVQVSAQSWPGLAADEDERYRIAAAADGGIWLLRTPHPEPVAALAGTRKVVDTTRRLRRGTALEPPGIVPGPARPGRRPGPDPWARGGAGRVHLPRRRHLRAGEAAGRGAQPRCRSRPGLTRGAALRRGRAPPRVRSSQSRTVPLRTHPGWPRCLT